MFDEIWYELKDMKIDRNRNIGITSTLKNYVSMTYDKTLTALNTGWNSRSDTEEGHFNFCHSVLGLLRRLQTSDQSLISMLARNWFWYQRTTITIAWWEILTESEVQLFKVQWPMPHVALRDDINKLSMLRTLESDRYLSMSFRLESVWVSSVTEYNKAFTKRRLSLRSCDTLSLLCRPIERISCQDVRWL